MNREEFMQASLPLAEALLEDRIYNTKVCIVGPTQDEFERYAPRLAEVCRRSAETSLCVVPVTLERRDGWIEEYVQYIRKHCDDGIGPIHVVVVDPGLKCIDVLPKNQMMFSWKGTAEAYAGFAVPLFLLSHEVEAIVPASALRDETSRILREHHKWYCRARLESYESDYQSLWNNLKAAVIRKNFRTEGSDVCGLERWGPDVSKVNGLAIDHVWSLRCGDAKQVAIVRFSGSKPFSIRVMHFRNVSIENDCARDMIRTLRDVASGKEECTEDDAYIYSYRFVHSACDWTPDSVRSRESVHDRLLHASGFDVRTIRSVVYCVLPWPRMESSDDVDRSGKSVWVSSKGDVTLVAPRRDLEYDYDFKKCVCWAEIICDNAERLAFVLEHLHIGIQDKVMQDFHIAGRSVEAFAEYVKNLEIFWPSDKQWKEFLRRLDRERSVFDRLYEIAEQLEDHVLQRKDSFGQLLCRSDEKSYNAMPGNLVVPFCVDRGEFNYDATIDFRSRYDELCSIYLEKKAGADPEKLFFPIAYLYRRMRAQMSASKQLDYALRLVEMCVRSDVCLMLSLIFASGDEYAIFKALESFGSVEKREIKPTFGQWVGIYSRCKNILKNDVDVVENSQTMAVSAMLQLCRNHEVSPGAYMEHVKMRNNIAHSSAPTSDEWAEKHLCGVLKKLEGVINKLMIQKVGKIEWLRYSQRVEGVMRAGVLPANGPEESVGLSQLRGEEAAVYSDASVRNLYVRNDAYREIVSLKPWIIYDVADEDLYQQMRVWMFSGMDGENMLYTSVSCPQLVHRKPLELSMKRTIGALRS